MNFDPSEYVDRTTFWFALALVNAGLAQTKNRSRLIWFVVSLLLGPFATLFIVVFPPPQPIVDESAGS